MYCPSCGSLRPESVARCVCGHEFASNDPADPSTQVVANRASRLVAAVVDGLILLPSILILASLPTLGVFVLALTLIYQATLLTRDGQTLGKRMVGVRIVKVNTGRNGGFFTNVVLRLVLNLLVMGLVPFYGPVDVLPIFRRDRRCIHDLIAGTRVITARAGR